MACLHICCGTSLKEDKSDRWSAQLGCLVDMASGFGAAVPCVVCLKADTLSWRPLVLNGCQIGRGARGGFDLSIALL